MDDEIKIKTLTPLWTGDIEGQCSKIKETGLIGSLRWWYEALVRGLGGYACDPTDSTCKFDYKKYHATGNVKDGLHDVCDACRLFGCTDWSRRFRIEINPLTRDYIIPLSLSLLSGNQYTERELTKNFWLKKVYGPTNVFYGEFVIKILPLFHDHDKKALRNCFGTLLKIISLYGGLGAKVQNGFGIIQLFDEINVSEGIKFIKDNIRSVKTNNSINFKDFFSIRIKQNNKLKKYEQPSFYPNAYGLKDTFIPSGFSIKYDLRKKIKFFYLENNSLKINKIITNIDKVPGIKKDKCKSIARYLFGSDLEKWGSRINVSHLYRKNSEEDYQLRIWGFLPEKIYHEKKDFEISKNDLLNFFEEELGKIEDKKEGFECIEVLINGI